MFSFPVMAEGFILGASLIIAIGAQNAFILQQGLRKQHVLPLVAFCALADALLILLGVYGLGILINQSPLFVSIMLWAGVVFLTAYGLLAFKRALKGAEALKANASPSISLKRGLALVAGFTLLNPHVYLDTVVLLGTLSLKHPADLRLQFAGGAMLASFCWFFALGYGARLLAPVFATPKAWRILDALIGCTMWLLAAKLAFS